MPEIVVSLSLSEDRQQGVFTDAVNTYTSTTTDAMNYQIVTASTGTSMKLTFISVWGNLSTARTSNYLQRPKL